MLCIFFLLGLGLVQVYSSSYIFAIESFGNGFHFFGRQLVFAVIGISAMFVVAKLKWKYSRVLGFTLLFLALAGVIATHLPGFSVKVGGAHRWIKMPFGQRFEPGELLKVTFPLLLASLMVYKKPLLGKLDPFLRLSIVVVPLILLLKQPDFGTMFLLTVTTFCILFLFGLRWSYIIATFCMAIPAFYFLIMQVPYRYARIKGFLDPWADPSEKGFQVIQSMLSFHAGGVWGAGLGQGQGKLFFLPEAHTDFTLAVLGEEMGLVGFIVVLMVYGYLVFRGLQISARITPDFEKTVALGITLVFAFQIFVNVGVVLGLLPTKGLTLPFLSYGGSSLVATCLGFGWLLNIERSFCRVKARVRKASPIIRNSYW